MKGKHRNFGSSREAQSPVLGVGCADIHAGLHSEEVTETSWKTQSLLTQSLPPLALGSGEKGHGNNHTTVQILQEHSGIASCGTSKSLSFPSGPIASVS